MNLQIVPPTIGLLLCLLVIGFLSYRAFRAPDRYMCFDDKLKRFVSTAVLIGLITPLAFYCGHRMMSDITDKMLGAVILIQIDIGVIGALVSNIRRP